MSRLATDTAQSQPPPQPSATPSSVAAFQPTFTSQPQPQIHHTAHISDKAVLILPASSCTPPSSDTTPTLRTAPITIGEGSIIHPFARIDASSGPVSIGANCVLWEKCCVGSTSPTPSSSTTSTTLTPSPSPAIATTTLADGVITHPHAAVHSSATIGTGCTIGINAIVGANARLGRDVLVTSGGCVKTGQVLSDGAVVGVGGRILRQSRVVGVGGKGEGAEGSIEVDLARARELKELGEGRERELMRRLVQGRAGGGALGGGSAGAAVGAR